MGPASFWAPEHLVESSWLQHAPFAFWLIGAARPAAVVELGTHRGFSYLVFCQAIRDHRLSATAHAVDTWEGDEHAGYYGDEVLTQLRRLHDAEYSSFSTLIRSSFSDAASRFGDGSIDLLHIDGLHTYDAVKTDFETWKPKLSDRGIVLFHDTNEFTPGFGVHRFWAEIMRRVSVVRIPPLRRARSAHGREERPTTCSRARGADTGGRAWSTQYDTGTRCWEARSCGLARERSQLVPVPRVYDRPP